MGERSERADFSSAMESLKSSRQSLSAIFSSLSRSPRFFRMSVQLVVETRSSDTVRFTVTEMSCGTVLEARSGSEAIVETQRSG